MVTRADSTVDLALNRTRCWSAARKGDTKARDYLARRVSSVASAILRNRRDLAHAHDDLKQEAGLSMFGYLERHEQRPEQMTHFLKWRVKGVISTYRKRLRPPDSRPLDEAEAGTPDCDRPSFAASKQELQQVVKRCRAGLKEPYRLVLSMKYDLQLSVQEIAERLGQRRNTVAVRLFRAAKALTESLAREGFGPSDLR